MQTPRELDLTDDETPPLRGLACRRPATVAKRINPYFLGYKILEDIERRFSDGGKDLDAARAKLFEVREIENDASLLRNYLTRELCDDLDLYVYGWQGDDDIVTPAHTVHIQIKIVTKFARQVIAEKRGIVLDLAHLEEFGACGIEILAAVRKAPLNVFENLVAEEVRIDALRLDGCRTPACKSAKAITSSSVKSSSRTCMPASCNRRRSASIRISSATRFSKTLSGAFSYGGKDLDAARAKLFEVREIENDALASRNYLTRELCDDLDLYVYGRQGDDDIVTLPTVHIQIKIVTKFARQVIAEKRGIVLDLAHLGFGARHRDPCRRLKSAAQCLRESCSRGRTDDALRRRLQDAGMQVRELDLTDDELAFADLDAGAATVAEAHQSVFPRLQDSRRH